MKTATKATHTPGPWRWFYTEERKGHEEIGIRPSDVAQCFAYVSITTPEDQANAQLMVAAPDMLEALELDATADKLERDDPTNSRLAIQQFRGLAREKRVAAIAKAKGGAA